MACRGPGPRIGRGAQLASLLATVEGAEPGRAALLAIWHDSQETRTGDLPHTARPYLDQCSLEVITADQTAALPDTARKTVQDAVTEYESQRYRRPAHLPPRVARPLTSHQVPLSGD